VTDANHTPTQAIDRTYARALLELADEADQTQAIGEEVNDLAGVLAGEPAFATVLTNRVIGQDARSAFLQKVLQGRVSDTLYRFVQVVNNHGRSDRLGDIFRAFNDLMADRSQVVQATATVAQGLDQDALNHLRDRLAEKLGKTVQLEQVIDPAVLGGVVLRVGDELIDGSVATQLRTMKNRLVTAGREKARQLAAQA
jgi:F-type H+-transporting ATPase subunit delta